MQKNHLALSSAERANALGVVRILEDMLKNSPARMCMHARAIRQALERADRLDERWLARNFRNDQREMVRP
jgi:hypothetical protein